MKARIIAPTTIRAISPASRPSDAGAVVVDVVVVVVVVVAVVVVVVVVGVTLEVGETA